MITLVLYYIVIPIVVAGYVVKFIRKHGASTIPPDVAALYAAQPVQKKWYRAARRDEKGLHVLGDFEIQLEAVDRAYLGKEQAEKAGEAGSFLVLNDQGDVYQQVDAAAAPKPKA